MSEARDRLMTAARDVATDSAMPDKARALARVIVSIVPLLEQAALERAERAAAEAIRQRDAAREQAAIFHHDAVSMARKINDSHDGKRERIDVLAWLETERTRWARDVGEVFDRIADQIASGAHVGTVKDIAITPYVPTPEQDRRNIDASEVNSIPPIEIIITNNTDQPRDVTVGWSGFAPTNGR